MPAFDLPSKYHPHSWGSYLGVLEIKTTRINVSPILLRPGETCKTDPRAAGSDRIRQTESVRGKATSPEVTFNTRGTVCSIQRVPEKGVSRFGVSCRAKVWKDSFQPVTVDCPGQGQANLRELTSPLLRECSRYLFLKKPKGKKVQNLRLPKKNHLFLLNNG